MEENKFRKNGSAEVDKAWESLGVDCMCSLSFAVIVTNNL